MIDKYYRKTICELPYFVNLMMIVSSKISFVKWSCGIFFLMLISIWTKLCHSIWILQINLERMFSKIFNKKNNNDQNFIFKIFMKHAINL